MPIVAVKELEARRAARRVADAAQRADAAAATSPPNTEVNRAAERFLPRGATSLRVNPVVPATSEVDNADNELVAEPVGYCRPPVASRFRRGDGRPRGPVTGSRRPQSLDAICKKWLGGRTSARIGGELIKVTRGERLFLRKLEMAEKGDYRAMRDLLDRYDRTFPKDEAAKVVRPDLTATDQATLDAFRAQIMSGLSKK